MTDSKMDYRTAKELVVDGVLIKKGSLLSELRKRGGVWTNRVWTDRLIKNKSLLPVRQTTRP